MLIVFSTFPDEATARTICASLVEEGLVACVNLLPQVTSIYRWQGELKEEGETLAILKLPAGDFPHWKKNSLLFILMKFLKSLRCLLQRCMRSIWRG
jgi:periplasmic divalent cation tolerance protein